MNSETENQYIDTILDRVKVLEEKISKVDYTHGQLLASKGWIIFSGSFFMLLLGAFFGIKGLFDIDDEIRRRVEEAKVDSKLKKVVDDARKEGQEITSILKSIPLDGRAAAAWFNYDGGSKNSKGVTGIRSKYGIKEIGPRSKDNEYLVSFAGEFESVDYAYFAFSEKPITFSRQSLDSIVVKAESDSFSLLFFGKFKPTDPTRAVQE
ncbi:hypothetical protein [Gimesia aquarii]|uniref:Uncharacterized protein n=1 Tax=Gimesia aquarii TaxID=2527964 RepID=A0A517VYE0_9PLAN|nr:hypothetical protein [Gimesia aquarii]QDT98023.1 hypothetical protein V144x_35070 [Gimesia aquarii]